MRMHEKCIFARVASIVLAGIERWLNLVAIFDFDRGFYVMRLSTHRAVNLFEVKYRDRVVRFESCNTLYITLRISDPM